MSCTTTCYERDTRNTRWHLVAIFGAAGQMLERYGSGCDSVTKSRGAMEFLEHRIPNITESQSTARKNARCV
eukprot:4717043-Pleurochrysis_carterae.AAC.3